MREDAVALLVADGMGGHQGGEEASRQAIVTFIEQALAAPMWIFRLEDERTAELVARARRGALSQGERRDRRARGERPAARRHGHHHDPCGAAGAST